ncbi:hypothetical protein AC579_8361 [Pseudocercospora musae]|uniref:Uncharacterized protein n=1 Tax=Pseudocercospora musae TaxID=113226 RepID=A0A139II38_9PEZI|nr:hypothetical protein AC579_8361 [Pseudocercospora musae]
MNPDIPIVWLIRAPQSKMARMNHGKQQVKIVHPAPDQKHLPRARSAAIERGFAMRSYAPQDNAPQDSTATTRAHKRKHLELSADTAAVAMQE